MEMMPVKPERKAQLEEYAKRRGQDTVTALDDALATYLSIGNVRISQKPSKGFAAV